jgi:hypothetical protein
MISNWPLRPLSHSEYAAYERRQGAVVIEASGGYWRRVRPLFYRPVFPIQILDPTRVQGPCKARWGGYQFAVHHSAEANSTMALLLFRDSGSYRLECLDKKRRWEVRTASRRFTIRPLENVSELRAAHSVYLDFLQRTKYRYRRDRARAERFQGWAEAVFQGRNVLVLGAFSGGEIQAVGICPTVDQTLIYATFFARETALKQHVASLMLHTIRSLAAGSGSVCQVYVGLRKNGVSRSVDAFYLERGCEVVLQPACSRVHPLTAWLLRVFQPGLWARISGTADLDTARQPVALPPSSHKRTVSDTC